MTLKSMRLHIAIFGRTNAGKSTLLNRIAGQDVSIVSEIPGTTTDVVEKSMELLPIGPVTFLDTAGLDDVSELGEKRVEKTLKVLNRTDVAVIVADEVGEHETELIERLEKLKIPYFIFNREDEVSKFKEMLVRVLGDVDSPKIIGDLVPAGSTVILVIPIDKEAPKGRIILPQVQTIRDLLDNECITIAVKETDLQAALDNLKTPPALVVTDSQAFSQVSKIVPENIPLTSFSILFARLKGDLDEFVKGAQAIESLQDADKVLILESCTHHAIEDDIGRVKIPKWLRQKTGKDLKIENYAGHDMPEVAGYSLIIHCGACMTNRREVLSRILIANDKNIPITNYGVVIAYCLGILPRAISPLSGYRQPQMPLP